ncbi:hypothetical protein Psfp_03328 [Pelotomaculum sp. FP]|uniref:hypothetical protein n=1 Tax=Pelotomaculum sp. FP TaxID=261474 RepID=UPI0010652473|nr:hypothetical protein [Pelotomaculum sp. FP]TEB13912.1 hypothetical protein Psfp_03328 [Pelotomaculum sp. FP]
MLAVAEPDDKVKAKARENFFKGKITATEYLKEIEASSETDRIRRESAIRVKKIVEESKIIFG